jgi:hypothetical protein
MDRQNLIQRLVARKLQPAASRKAICGACIGGAGASRKAIYIAEAQPKK